MSECFWYNLGMKAKKIIRIVLMAAIILAIPLVAMQFSDDWNWKLSDFVIIGIIVVGAGLLYEFVASKLKTPKQRMLFGILVALAVLLTWAELAVGLFGTPFAGS